MWLAPGKTLTDSVNAMASNLTVQLRDRRTSRPDRERRSDEDKSRSTCARNSTDQGRDQSHGRSAERLRERGHAGREGSRYRGQAGGQAIVPGVPGTWKDLTESVNLLAANLTTQVRAIAEVATAVTQGDLTRSIQVQARGEVAELKDNINVMIRTLRATTDQNTEQDWLKPISPNPPA